MCDFCDLDCSIGWIIDAENYMDASRRLDNHELEEDEYYEFCADCGLEEEVLDLKVDRSWQIIIR